MSALLAFAIVASAATRPHYGGTLRLDFSATDVSLDPLAQTSTAGQAMAQRHIITLLYESLPALSAAWQHDDDFRRWEFQLRAGVRFHSGTPLTPAFAAQSLNRSASGAWRASAVADKVVVQADEPLTNALAELALPRHAIVHRTANGFEGTGPFRLAPEQVPQQIVLVANDAYWRGRPYLDGIEISLAHPLRQQLIELEAGNAGLVELAPDQVRRAQQEGRRTSSSAPNELLVLVFNAEHRAMQDPDVRQAIAASIDRNAIANVLLQREAAPSAALLPQWMTGYNFLFRSAKPAGPHASSAALPLVLDYDFADPISKLVAERLALNARDAGVAIQPVGENFAQRSAAADMKLLRIPLASSDIKTALLELSSPLNLDRASIERANTPLELYRAESDALADYRIVPVAHLSESNALSPALRDFLPLHDGSWNLPDVWIESPHP